jgi:3-oxoacyl-[acyl-carrier protein] reductase
MIEQPLTDKIVVITGGSGNIGSKVAMALAERGARIISIVRRDLESAQEKMNQLPNAHLNHLAIFADVKDSKSLKTAVANLDITKCDILINNAGRSHAKVVYREITDDIADDIMDTNVKGLFYTVREFLGLIYKAEEPIIINISSASARNPGRANLMYAASKAAVDNMTKCMAINMSPKVRVVGISPSWLEHAVSGAPVRTSEDGKTIAPNFLLHRIPRVDEVVETIVTVATGFKFMTGTILPVDCGIISS